MAGNPKNRSQHHIRIERAEAIAMAVDHLPVGIGLFHMDGRPVLINDAFRQLYQIDPGINTNASFAELIEAGAFANWKEDPKAYFKRVFDCIRSGGTFSAEVAIGDRVILVQDRSLDGKYILSSQLDISSRVAAEQRAAHLAQHDPLTDLPNRAAFASRLDGALRQAQASGTGFAVMSVDLDRFKDVNDIFGHGMGDALLKEMSARFRDAAGANFVARNGGDEFVFLCIDGPQPDSASALADRLFETCSGEICIEGRPLLASFSIGVAIYPADGADVTALFNNADAALYRAKADGRGVVRFFEPAMDKRIHEQRLLLQDLRLALARNEFALHYQPEAKVNGEITGFEALLRWYNPARGLIMPDGFIELAEDSGLVIGIGEWVLREACREAASWDRSLCIAVNVSPIQFRHGDFAALVLNILVETGLSPSRLEIEITEGVLVHDFDRALSILRRLKAMGVQIAMDDFGTGYSSLSYLRAFPFDKLKIDRSFIANAVGDHQTAEIVRAIIRLGEGLDLPIIAEGVETEAQLAFLIKEQCPAIQGFLIGKAEPISQYRAITTGVPAKQTSRPPRRRGKRQRSVDPIASLRNHRMLAGPFL
jgi:diguanylate cyclase (GGDEF)-like protein